MILRCCNMNKQRHSYHVGNNILSIQIHIQNVLYHMKMILQDNIKHFQFVSNEYNNHKFVNKIYIFLVSNHLTLFVFYMYQLHVDIVLNLYNYLPSKMYIGHCLASPLILVIIILYHEYIYPTWILHLQYHL